MSSFKEHRRLLCGDPESLAGRINIKDMGSRAAHDDALLQNKKRSDPVIERGGIREGGRVGESKRREGEGSKRSYVARVFYQQPMP